jgi:hypothetical protein
MAPAPWWPVDRSESSLPESRAIDDHRAQDALGLRHDIVNEADLRTALGKLADATGTKQGQSQGQGRVSKFRGRQKRKVS